MIDSNNQILGVVEFRQHRMPNDSCPLPDRADILEATCIDDFRSNNYIRQKVFYESWNTSSDASKRPAYPNIWKFKDIGPTTPGE